MLCLTLRSLPIITQDGVLTGISNRSIEFLDLSEEENLHSIGESSIANCFYLTSVTLSNTITTIEASAFANCSRLATINWPSSLSLIGNSAFQNCSSLQVSIIFQSAIQLRELVFAYCIKLVTFSGKNIDKMGSRCFEHSKFSQRIDLDSLTLTVPYNTFYRCELVDLHLSIGCASFSFQEAIIRQQLEIGPNSTIRESAFSGATVLGSLKFLPEVFSIPARGFVTMDIRDTIIFPNDIIVLQYDCFRGTKIGGTLTLPSHVEIISSGAFHSFYSASATLTININVRSIEADAFKNCQTKGSLSINMETIRKDRFNEASFDKELKLGSNVYTIEDGAFNGTKFSTIIFPRVKLSVGSLAFGFMESLTTLKNFDLVELSDSAFAGSCLSGSLQIDFELNNEKIFTHCQTTEVSFGDDVSKIPAESFSNNLNLRKITFGPNIRKIGNCAFFNCQSLESIHSFKSITILSEAFGKCSLLQITSLLDCTIGIKAFYECRIGEALLIKNTNLDENCFEKTSIESLTISGMFIPVSCFSCCVNLKKVSIADSIFLDKLCFNGCSSLTSVDMDTSLVESQSFRECYSIDVFIIRRPFNITGVQFFEKCNVTKVIYQSTIEFTNEERMLTKEPILEFPMGYQFNYFMGFSVKFHNISELDNRKNISKTIIITSAVAGSCFIILAFISIYLVMRRSNKILRERIELSVRLVDDFG